jgi:hypothetical protein
MFSRVIWLSFLAGLFLCSCTEEISEWKCDLNTDCKEGEYCDPEGNCVEGQPLALEAKLLKEAYIGESYSEVLVVEGGLEELVAARSRDRLSDQ